MFHVNVSAPSDAIADHQSTHENSIVSADAKLGEDELVVWIPAAQSTDDESVEVDVGGVEAELFEVADDRLVFADFFLPSFDEGCVVVLERCCYVDDGGAFVGFVDCNNVGADVVVEARNCFVDLDCCCCWWFVRFDESVKDCVVSSCDCWKSWWAMTKHVWKSFVVESTPSAFLVIVTWNKSISGAIQRDDVQTSSKNETPICKSGVFTRFGEVVCGRLVAEHLESFALIRFVQ